MDDIETTLVFVTPRVAAKAEESDCFVRRRPLVMMPDDLWLGDSGGDGALEQS